MKGKKGSFANSSTGYGKFKSNSHSSNNRSSSNSNKTEKTDVKNDKGKTETNLEQEQDLNSGFGDYLRTPEAVEMMKLFVFANSVMLILTMAWPHMKEQYYMLMHWLNSFRMEEKYI